MSFDEFEITVDDKLWADFCNHAKRQFLRLTLHNYIIYLENIVKNK